MNGEPCFVNPFRGNVLIYVITLERIEIQGSIGMTWDNIFCDLFISLLKCSFLTLLLVFFCWSFLCIIPLVLLELSYNFLDVLLKINYTRKLVNFIKFSDQDSFQTTELFHKLMESKRAMKETSDQNYWQFHNNFNAYHPKMFPLALKILQQCLIIWGNYVFRRLNLPFLIQF